MIRGLRRTAPTNTRSAVKRNDTPTEKVVFSWDSVAEKTPSKNRYLKRNFLLPQIDRQPTLWSETRCREIRVSTLNGVAMNRV